MTATCLATGEWDRNIGEIVCRGKCIHTLACNNTFLLNHLQLLFVIAPAYLMGVDLMQLSPSVWLSRQLYSQSLDC